MGVPPPLPLPLDEPLGVTVAEALTVVDGVALEERVERGWEGVDRADSVAPPTGGDSLGPPEADGGVEGVGGTLAVAPAPGDAVGGATVGELEVVEKFPPLAVAPPEGLGAGEPLGEDSGVADPDFTPVPLGVDPGEPLSVPLIGVPLGVDPGDCDPVAKGVTLRVDTSEGVAPPDALPNSVREPVGEKELVKVNDGVGVAGGSVMVVVREEDTDTEGVGLLDTVSEGPAEEEPDTEGDTDSDTEGVEDPLSFPLKLLLLE